jgi:hypothetical protein
MDFASAAEALNGRAPSRPSPRTETAALANAAGADWIHVPAHAFGGAPGFQFRTHDAPQMES